MDNVNLNVKTPLKVKPKHLLHRDQVKQFKYQSYPNVGLTLAQRQTTLRIFLNATVWLNLPGLYDIYCLLYQSRIKVCGLAHFI